MAVCQKGRHRGLALLGRSYGKVFPNHRHRCGYENLPTGTQSWRLRRDHPRCCLGPGLYNPRSVGASEQREAAIAVCQKGRHRGLALLGRSN